MKHDWASGAGGARAFQTRKDCGSTTVGCTTSRAGNTPHVTALTCAQRALGLGSPYPLRR